MMRMTIVDRFDQLPKDNSSLALIKCSLINQSLKDTTISTKTKLRDLLLLNDYDTIAFFESLVNFNDRRIVQAT